MMTIFRLTAIISVTTTRLTVSFSPPVQSSTSRALFASSAATTRLFSAISFDSESLSSRAKEFIRYKNAAGSGESTLDPVFDMCSKDVDLYGLKGDKVRPGFIAFFDKHDGLQHEIIDNDDNEPTTTIDTESRMVQYPFTKTWKDENGEWNTWKSVDPAKPRKKVERLEFDEEGMLLRVSIVDLAEERDA